MFLAIVPLLMSALNRDARTSLQAAAIASFALGALGGSQLFVMFVVAFALPCWYFGQEARRCMIARDNSVIYKPIGLLMLDMTYYACIAMAMIVLYVGMTGPGITALLNEQARAAASKLPPDYASAIEMVTGALGFLFFSMLGWMWVIGLYGHAWIANRILARQNRLQRASLALEIFTIPSSLLFFVSMAALASFIGSESMQFLAKACLIMLLLPYFLSGLALLHHHSTGWPGRGFLLFLIYIFLISQPWALLLMAMAGLIYQLLQMNKALSLPPDSPK